MHSLHVTLAAAGVIFDRFVGKSAILIFRYLSAVELLLLTLWATKLELLGHKSHVRAAQSRLGRASRSKV